MHLKTTPGCIGLWFWKKFLEIDKENQIKSHSIENSVSNWHCQVKSEIKFILRMSVVRKALMFYGSKEFTANVNEASFKATKED